MSQHSIIPAALAITSMRDSGYKTAAHAIAELIDNSIQANANTVQLICIDKTNATGQRRIKHVDEIAIFDNGKGMAAHTLQQALQFGGGAHRDDPNGIGKFGMGLPSATISQCRKLDVYSWKNGICHYTYLDVDEIESGSLSSVPAPIQKSIPAKWLEAIGEDYNSDHGTIAIWSNLDRVTWKTSKSLYTHSEKLIGRMYRHFIASKEVMVRFKSFTNDVTLVKGDNSLFKVNDPLFLYQDTVLPPLPGDYKNQSFFEPLSEEPQKIDVTLNDGTAGRVTIKYSQVVRSIHQAILRESTVDVGRTPYGKLAAENNGVSIVRSRRELKLSDIFSSSDPRDRWFGVEISFTPALDELFGVTFDKQDVVNFELIDLKVEAENEGYDSDDASQFNEFKDKFERDKSDRYWIYHIVSEIQKNLATLRKHTQNLKDKAITKSVQGENKISHAEEVAKKVAQERLKQNKLTNTDKEFLSPDKTPEQKQEEVKKTLMNDFGVDVGTAAESSSAEDTTHSGGTLPPIESDCNVKFIEHPLRGNAFFEIESKAGMIIVLLNNNHEFYKFYEQFDDEKKELMKLVLIAWAQCEDASDSSTKSDMEDIRGQWGKMMKKYLFELNEQ